MVGEVSRFGVSVQRLCWVALAVATAALALAGSAFAKGTSPAGINCQPYAKKPCLVPFPNNLFTSKDKKTETGRRLDLPQKAMPSGNNGRIDVGPYDMNDGFDPGSTIIVRIPRMDTPAAYDKTKPVPQNNIGQYLKKSAPVVLIDAKTGKRQPIWTELDSTSPSTDTTTLLIHPAKLLAEGHTFIVALRKMKKASGKELKAPKWFERLRDGRNLPKRERGDKSRYKSIFKTLRKKAHIKRSSLYEAWDYTVASRKSLTTTMLSIRDDAFKDLGDTNLSDGDVAGDAPAFAVTDVTTTGLAPGIAREVQGTFTAPCYLDSANCALGGKFSYSGGTYPHPHQNGTTTVHFSCAIPTSADTTPGRGMVYGHGLFGEDTQAVDNGGGEGVSPLDANYNFVSCGTEFWGLADDSSGAPGTESDLGYDLGVLGDLSQFPTIGDRFQQAYVNQLLLGRLMRSPDGFVDDDNFQNGSNQPVIDTSQLYYYGNSQGGIQGGGYTALSPDISRSVLGVPGLDYGGLLLQRSSDFAPFEPIIQASYTDHSQYSLILDLLQQLWDKGEAEAYAQHMTNKPLPNTPSHKVLMHVAYGDHQVSMYSAMVEARTIGARGYEPNGTALDPARSAHDGNLFYGIKPISSFPFGGSGVAIWDDGPGAVPEPPYGNVPPTTGPDPHSHPRKTAAAQLQIATFLNNATGTITDQCGDAPCHTDFFTP